MVTTIECFARWSSLDEFVELMVILEKTEKGLEDAEIGKILTEVELEEHQV